MLNFRDRGVFYASLKEDSTGTGHGGGLERFSVEMLASIRSDLVVPGAAAADDKKQDSGASPMERREKGSKGGAAVAAQTMPFGKCISIETAMTPLGKKQPLISYETCGLFGDLYEDSQDNKDSTSLLDPDDGFTIHPNVSNVLAWRKGPIQFARTFDAFPLCVVASGSVVDVWEIHGGNNGNNLQGSGNGGGGRIVHIFETKKNRLQDLSCLLIRHNRCFLLAHEEKDASTSIIIIQVDPQLD